MKSPSSPPPPEAHRGKAYPSSTLSLSGKLWIARLAVLVAGGISTYLLAHALSQESVGGCGPGSGCDRVLGSHWAYLGPVPVSASALLTYLALLIASFKVEPARGYRFRPGPWFSLVFLASLVLFAALWFTGLQGWRLGAWCKYCLTAHTFGSTAALLCLKAAWDQHKVSQAVAEVSTFTSGKLPASRMAASVCAALGAIALLAWIQTTFPHRLNVVRVHRGTFKLKFAELPRLGSEKSSRVVVSLFDYTCPDCRHMHQHLQSALTRYAGELAVTALPLPLDSKCNPLVRRTQPKHEQACEYARLGLGLRRVSNEAFQTFDDWFFGQTDTPPLAACQEKARAIAGADSLQRAIADRWVDETLQLAISLYELNGNITGAYRMPQLILGDRVNIGPLHSDEALFDLLERHVGVTAPTPKTP